MGQPLLGSLNLLMVVPPRRLSLLLRDSGRNHGTSATAVTADTAEYSPKPLPW